MSNSSSNVSPKSSCSLSCKSSSSSSSKSSPKSSQNALSKTPYPTVLPDNNTITRWTAENFFTHEPFDFVHSYLHTDYSVGMHSHDFYEINIVLKGSGRHYIGEQSCFAGLGSFFVIPPNTKHGYFPLPKLDVFHVLLSRSFLDRYADELHLMDGFSALFEIEPMLRPLSDEPLFPSISVEKLLSLNLELNLLLDLSEAKPTPSINAKKSARALALVATLCSYMTQHIHNDYTEQIVFAEQKGHSKQEVHSKPEVHPKPEVPSEPEVHCENKAYIEFDRRTNRPSLNDYGSHTTVTPAEPSTANTILRVLEFVHQNYDQTITTNTLAQLANMSRSTFIRSFKTIVNCPPNEYLTHFRIEKAKSLLCASDKQITDIATLCGFYDSSHLIKHFERAEGISPKEFRHAQNQIT